MYSSHSHKFLIVSLFLSFVIFSCSEETPLPDKEGGSGRGPACRIDSLIFEENWHNPLNYYYNEEGNISSYQTYYTHYKFHYSGKKVNLVEVFTNDQLEQLYELQYIGELISKIIYKYADGAVFMELRFLYTEDQVDEVQVWRSNPTELYLSQYYNFTFEEGNVTKMETIVVNNTDAENTVASYIYDDKPNPFKNDLAHFFYDGYLIKFFSSNNILTLHEEKEDGSSYKLSYSYKYNNKGFPTKIIYADNYEEMEEYDITYTCD